MRDYEFRGKLLNTNVWIYGNLRIHLVDGYLDQSEKRYYIEYNYMDKHGQVFRDSYEVDPSTIGQFTGLVDKNGKRIYEGDRIRVFGFTTNPKTKEKIPYNVMATIKYSDVTACFLYFIDDSSVWSNFRYVRADGLDYEVIGNIHDKENEK